MDIDYIVLFDYELSGVIYDETCLLIVAATYSR